jgi:two-component system nitrogen regulation sensor histidine kinase NtrY
MSATLTWRRLVTRVRQWSHAAAAARWLAVALTLAVFFSGIATFTALTRSGPLGGPNPRTVFSLLILNLLLILPLGALIGRRIARVWAERRAGVAGAKLHVRLVVMFSAVAITPAIVVAVFSGLLINIGVEQWFNQRVSTALDESLAVANAYLFEHQQVIGGDAMAMANDIERQGPALLRSPGWLAQVLAAQQGVRALTEAIVFDGSGRVLARSGIAFSMELSIDRIPAWAFERARVGGFAVLTAPGDERVRALVRLERGAPDIFLYVGRFVDPKVIGHMDRTAKAVDEYRKLDLKKSGLEVTFSAIYAVVALLLLLGAIWVGLTLATQLATPIIRLIDASEKIRAGDLTARVVHAGATDELGSLSRAFNRMADQLAQQRRNLLEANNELDERRRFTEAVLEGVSPGVIGLDRNGVVELPNRSAAEYLETDPLSMIGKRLVDVVPEFRELLTLASDRLERSVQKEITLSRDGRSRVFLVRIVAERAESAVAGYVVTLDDMTELMAAQRKAAWADVARRIAHEIKNPLTPIQLSAERLKRKYLKMIDTDRETFLNCTDTIIRQVGDIGRMVEEFSSFARMPVPMMKEDDLLEVVRQSVFLAKNGYSDVTFSTNLAQGTLNIPCDSRQVGQAMTNLLKNAVEAIRGRDGDGLPKGQVNVSVTREDETITVTVEDNGRGLPRDMRDRLTEPYVTTQVKGTGLGLAIVKKIMEDHGGRLTLADRPGGGSRVSLVFRAPPLNDTNVAAKPVTSHGA